MNIKMELKVADFALKGCVVNQDYEKVYLCGLSNEIKILDLSTLKEISSIKAMKDEANKVMTCIDKLDTTSVIMGTANN